MKLSLIVSGLMKLLEAGHYSERTVERYHHEWRKLRKFLIAEYGGEEFELSKGMLFLKKHYHLAPDGSKRLSAAQKLYLRSVKMLETYRTSGIVAGRPARPNRDTVLEASYASVYAKYDKAIASMELSEVTRLHYRTIARKFLGHVQSQGLQHPSEIKLVNCHRYLKSLDGFTPKGIQQIVCGVRHLLRFMLREKITFLDLAPQLRAPRISAQAALPSVWSVEELRKLLDAPDLTTAIGKRDYAMMLLGCVLGIRSIDIKNLKLGDFDWTDKKLRFKQHKTQRIIELPLPDPVGRAVIDYIEDGRPNDKTKSKIVFLNTVAPFGPIPFSNHLTSRMREYCEKAGIAHDRKWGFHSLRHSAATLLLEMGTPLPIITEILGHASPNMTAVYLKEDVSKLAECVLEPEDFTDEKDKH